MSDRLSPYRESSPSKTMLRIVDSLGGALAAPLKIALIAAGYYLAIAALYAVAFNEGWAIFWPVNGFTVAWLLGRPRRDWPVIMAGVFIGTLLIELDGSHSFAQRLIERVLSTIEVVYVAWQLPKFTTLDDWLAQPGLVTRITQSLLIGPGVTGIFGAITYHHFEGIGYLEGFSWWALADAIGLAAMIPFAFALVSPQTWRLFRPDRLLRTLRLLVPAFVAVVLIFSISRYPLLFLLYPVLLLVDQRLGFSASAITVAWICLVSVYTTTNDLGPFASLSEPAYLKSLYLQIFLGFHILILFPVSVLFLERSLAQRRLIEAHDSMARLATLDPLTGISNRRTLDVAFGLETRRAVIENSTLGFVMIDIDHFKIYNDTLGHPAGDRCIVEVAAIIGTQARKGIDVVARYGGEEFAILVPQCSRQQVDRLAESIVRAVAERCLSHPTMERVTVSVGAAALPGSALNRYPDLLLELADKALYQAKKSGRNRFQLADEKPEAPSTSGGTAPGHAGIESVVVSP